MVVSLKEYLLDEVCEFVNGFAFKSKDYIPKNDETIEVLRMGYIERGGGFKEDSTPVFVPKNYERDLSKYHLQYGDIVIAMTDMKDRVAILANTARITQSDRFVLNQRVGCIRVKRKDLIDQRFLYYYSNSANHIRYLRSRANSGVQVNLGTSAIKSATLTVPSLHEQKAIAQILGTLDDKIELNRQTNKTLESIARAIFKSWFVDFDPVRVKRDGVPGNGLSGQGDKATPYSLSPDILDLFPDSFQDSELGEIPVGWEVSTVFSHADVSHGYAYKGEYFSDSITQDVLVTPGNFNVGGGFKTDKLKFYNGPIEEKYILAAGDLVVTMTDLSKAADTLGYPAFIPESENRTYHHNQRIGKVTLKDGSEVGKEFLFQFFSSDRYRYEVLATASGSTVSHTSPKKILDIPVISPSKEIAKAYEGISQGIRAKNESNNEEINTLVLLRNTLLPKLISGELRIKDAEKLIANAPV